MRCSNSAKAMLGSGRFLYVGCMCHQVVEKALKAVLSQNLAKEEIAPKTHNLIKLANLCGIYEDLSKEQQDFLAQLNPLNIEARYPQHKEQLLKAMNKTECEKLIFKTEVFLCLIKSRLKK
ncbi:MAG: HEPN domain-containing protein [Firmicutes bacterium]|nr:HEPN domain-containing protein [Bacillota bacterium]